MKQTKNVFYYLFLSVAAAVIILALALVKPSAVNTITMNDKLLISSVFIASCILGISLATHPSWLRRLTKHTSHDSKKEKPRNANINYKGHHPDCGRFRSHRVITKNKTLCAGCLGLAIGSTVSIFLIIIYIFIIKEQSTITLYFLLSLGLIIISLNYVEIMLPMRNAIVHVISNVFLVIGFLMLTVSVFEITGNKTFGILTVLLSFLWVDTRIQLSKWQHTRICQNCSETCKMY